MIGTLTLNMLYSVGTLLTISYKFAQVIFYSHSLIQELFSPKSYLGIVVSAPVSVESFLS
jgi:hypothetical protein